MVTLYPEKNEASTLSLLGRLGISSNGYVPVTNRVATEGNGTFTDTMQVAFREAGDYDRTLSWDWYCSYSGSIEGSDTWNSSFLLGKSVADLNSSYTFDNNIETKYELGKMGAGAVKPALQQEADFKSVFSNNPFCIGTAGRGD